MALPYKWVDSLVSEGALRVLEGSDLKVLFAIGRFVNTHTLQCRANSGRLRELTGLPRRTFFLAQRRLCDLGLITVTRQGRKVVYNLVSPVPPLHSAVSSLHSSVQPIAPQVQPIAPANGETPLPSSTPTLPTAQINTQLGKQIRSLLLRQFPELVRVWGREVDVVQEMMTAAQSATDPARLGDDAHRLSRILQAGGVLTFENEMREVLRDVVAILDPTVEAAIRIFNGEIIAVNRVETRV